MAQNRERNSSRLARYQSESSAGACRGICVVYSALGVLSTQCDRDDPESRIGGRFVISDKKIEFTIFVLQSKGPRTYL